MNPENSNKTALITGAAKRVGQAIAVALAADGWNVALHYNSSDVSETAAQCQKLGVRTTTIRADLNNFDELQAILPQANAALGEVTLLINNASIFDKCSFADTDEDTFNRHQNINFKAPFFLSQEFAKQTKNGHIINITDTRVVMNKVDRFAYTLSKKSFASLNDMLAVELGPEIRVNAIAPGAIEEFCDNLEQQRLADRIANLPMKKLGNFSDIYSSMKMLINSELTGQCITVDGGDRLV